MDNGDGERRDERTLSITFGWDETKQPNSVQTGLRQVSPEPPPANPDGDANANGIVLADAK